MSCESSCWLVVLLASKEDPRYHVIGTGHDKSRRSLKYLLLYYLVSANTGPAASNYKTQDYRAKFTGMAQGGKPNLLGIERRSLLGSEFEVSSGKLKQIYRIKRWEFAQTLHRNIKPYSRCQSLHYIWIRSGSSKSPQSVSFSKVEILAPESAHLLGPLCSQDGEFGPVLDPWRRLANELSTRSIWMKRIPHLLPVIYLSLWSTGTTSDQHYRPICRLACSASGV